MCNLTYVKNNYLFELMELKILTLLIILISIKNKCFFVINFLKYLYYIRILDILF